MELITIASGSRGNGYLLRATDGETLMLECGVSMQAFKLALDYDIKGLRNCVVSHQHKDHSLYIRSAMQQGIKVMALGEVFRMHKLPGNSAMSRVMKPLCAYKVGTFTVHTIPLAHDVPNLGFIIDHEEMGRTLFATDTFMIEYKLPRLRHIMIECNYADDLVKYNMQAGLMSKAQRDRLMTSHMELGNLKKLLRKMDLSETQDIVLLHTSEGDGDKPRFIREVMQETGIQTYVAETGFRLLLGKEPY
ncbi:MAG: MBL fold metallo-hydrolase [Prevotellaceae bacterium]|nr:MBL fold metallo-hydrolase [Prevotellaceae bacterium]